MFSGIWRKAKKKNMKKERKFGLKEFPRPLKPVYGGVGKDMEESEAEFRAETQETTGIHEGNAAGRI